MRDLREPLKVSVIVPWHNTDPDREASWQWLKLWYKENMPDAELIEISPQDGDTFNKPQLINTAAQYAAGDVLIIADADVLPAEPDALHKAMEHAAVAPWVVPHGHVLRLRPEPTAQALSADVGRSRLPHGPLIRPPYRGIAGGGLFVITRDNFLATGGFDPAFTGWGGEDTAFGIAADCLLGKHLRYDHVPLVHFYHNPGMRSLDPQYAPNMDRVQMYRRLAAAGRDAMAAFRSVPPTQESTLLVSRPERDDDVFEWLLYLNSLGVEVGQHMRGNKLALMNHAVNNEWRVASR